MWNPKQYNKYFKQRNRPAIDLIERIPQNSYNSLIDLGCGDGVITKLLMDKFKPTCITGLDSSQSMLEKAKTLDSSINWQLGSIEKFDGNYDLIFSNAALHWIDNHNILFNQLMSQANSTIAIQMPNNFNEPSHVLLRETIFENSHFKQKLTSTIREAPVLNKSNYYKLLSNYANYIDIWETEYLQQLDGKNAVLEWVKGTALVPIQERLNQDEYAEFEHIYGEKLNNVYKPVSTNVTLFPFKRIFIIAAK